MKRTLVLQVLFVAGALAQSPRNDAPTFVNEADINAPLRAVWNIWSTGEGYKAVGAAKADVDLRLGGLIRSHYKPTGVLGDEGTIVNRILAYEPQRMMAIQIDRPPKGFPFKEAWRHTWTVIAMTDLGNGRTHLRVASMGFGADEESVAMRQFFEAGNAATLKAIQVHLESDAQVRGK